MTNAKPKNIFKNRLNNYDNMDPVDAEFEEAMKQYEYKKRIAKAKNIHPYPVYNTEKSGWFTTVDDIRRPNGKRKIRKSTQDALWEELAIWYLDRADGSATMAEVFELWIQWKETPKNAANIKRIRTSWNTYYASEPLSEHIVNRPMAAITSLELRTWAETLMKKHFPVDRKKFSRMFSIVNNCFEYAADEDVGIVPENLWQRARKKINKDLFVTASTPSDDSQVFTDNERREIRRLVFEDLETYQDRPTSAGLQILFLFETGLRIGECVGLKWSDVKKGRLYIRRQADNRGVREWTKTSSGYRDIPLTDEALRLLDVIKKYNDDHNLHAEWIFQSDNPRYDYRLSYNAANNKLTKLCARIDSVKKSPHKLRKTCLSALLDNPNVNNRTVQRYAGHSDITTTLRYYDFDRSSKEEQARAINEALALEYDDE